VSEVTIAGVYPGSVMTSTTGDSAAVDMRHGFRGTPRPAASRALDGAEAQRAWRASQRGNVDRGVGDALPDPFVLDGALRASARHVPGALHR
jgi:hypothetical protein